MILRRPYLLFLGDAPDALAAKTADGTSDLIFAGQATVIGVEGEVQFANVESPCSATFAIISDDGQNPNMGISG